MIVIHVKVKVKEDRRADFIQHANQEVKVARGYNGCLQYYWAEALDEPNIFSIYEEWESPEAFDRYKDSDHFKHLNEVFAPLMAAPPLSNYYSATSL